MNDQHEREEFEKWFVSEYGYDESIFRHDKELNDYFRCDVRTHWLAWKARAEKCSEDLKEVEVFAKRQFDTVAQENELLKQQLKEDVAAGAFQRQLLSEEIKRLQHIDEVQFLSISELKNQLMGVDESDKPVGYWQGEFSKEGGATLYEEKQESAFGSIYKNIPLFYHPKKSEMTEARAREILENEFGGEADNCHVLGFQYSIEVMKAYIFWVERKSEQHTGITE